MKCEVCKAKIEQTFLKKPIGAYVKNGKGKKFLICPQCQNKLSSKKEQLKHLPE